MTRLLQKLLWGGRLARHRLDFIEKSNRPLQKRNSRAGRMPTPQELWQKSHRLPTPPPLAILLTLCCLILLSACQNAPKPTGPTVQAEVVSGQTLEVTGVGDQPTLIQRVRLIGIEAPDVKQRPWGPQAKKRLEELVGKEPVLLESDVETKDSFDRKLAYVWKNGVLLNEQMVAEGLALFWPRSLATKYDERLEQAQEWARLMGLGIWNPEKPMRQSPSEFRRQNR
ncbi:thermonuclease family protein [Microseira sp. BLCC-F43]|uniref:thermonuclease family protein n=1 Tax=Microseira sp. BLCC-F43 TaxID=3153602 RepID=UPI0035B820FD